ncbi:MAG: phytanoyl-CoA dioxygenase family protein [Arenicellales bacterium]
MASHWDTESARRNLSADGFVVMPDVVEPAALEQLRRRVALFYRAWDRYPKTTRKEFPGRSPEEEYLPVREINWPPAALRLLDDEPAVTAIREVVDALTEAACRIIHANSLLKPAARGAPVLPHQDTAYNLHALNRPLTAWIPFEEVTEAGGAIFYLPGSHRLGALKHDSADGVRWLSEPTLKEHGDPMWRSYCGGPGSIGVHDSRLVHGSYANRSGRDRLALSLRFEVAGAKAAVAGAESAPAG